MVDWNPAQVEQAIYEAAQRIAKGVTICGKAYSAFLKADAAYDKAVAISYLNAEGPAHERKYRATLATEAERDARDVADAAYKLTERNHRAIQSELDALRSIGTSVRQAYQSAGVGER
jgi:hypothetical protein